MAIIISNSVNSNVHGNNTFLGSGSGNITLSGDFNIGLGSETLNSLTTGAENVGIGYNSLTAVSSGAENVTLGNLTGTAITTGTKNTIIGSGSGKFLVDGEQNTLIGRLVGSNYTTNESRNLIIGSGFSGTNLDNKKFFIGFIDGTVDDVSFAHNIGTENTFMGTDAGHIGLTVANAKYNTGFGSQSLGALTDGDSNCAFGDVSLQTCTTGTNNCAFGLSSLQNLTTGSDNIAVGTSSGTAYTGAEASNVCIGHIGVIADANTIRLGTDGNGAGQQDTCYIAGDVTTARSITATTGNITSATGDLISTAGAVDAATTVTAGTGITATTGDITATTGDLVSTAGAVDAATTVTAGTGVTATTGAVTATAGNVVITAGNLTLPDTNGTGTEGEILFGGSRFISNYGVSNTFIGEGSGNTTLIGGMAVQNVGVGRQCLSALTDGDSNACLGAYSLSALTTGINNVCLGCSVCQILTTGDNNCCIGFDALTFLLTGDRNIAIGTLAGSAYVAAESDNICLGNSGVLGDANTIRLGTDGNGAGQQDTCYIAGDVTTARSITATTGDITATTGDLISTAGAVDAATTVTAGTGITATTGDITATAGNVVITAGNLTLPNTNAAGTEGEITFGGNRFVSNYGTENTFVGEGSGNTTLTVLSARYNTAVGYGAFAAVTAAAGNVAVGYRALAANTSVGNNTAIGSDALHNLVNGGGNTAIGIGAFSNLASGVDNIGISNNQYTAGTAYNGAESHNILIANVGVNGESNKLRIGTTGSGAGQQNKCFIAGTTGVTPDTADAKLMIMDSLGQMGTLGAATNGQIAIGSTGANPVLAAITAGAGIGITNGAGSITIDATGSSLLPWSAQTVNMTAVVSNAYIANKAGTLEFLLPAASAVGSTFRVTGMNTALGWKITQAANQQIHLGISSSTIGAAGYIASSAIRDSVELVCVVADLEWNVVSSMGNITVA
jgi:hypothetical protein